MTGTIYPDGIDGNAQLPLVIDNVSPIRADDVNRLRQATVAVETELGINPSGTFGTVRARLDALEEAGGGGGGGGGVILTDKGDLITRTDDAEVAFPVGTDGYILISDSTTDTGLRWGSSSGQIVDFVGQHIQDPDNKEYFLSIQMPYNGSVESVTTIADAGTFTLTCRINGIAIGGSANSVSSVEQSQSHSSSNTFSIGDTLSVILTGVTVGVAQDLKFTIRLVRDNAVGNLGEVNIGQNVGIGGVGPYKQKSSNVLQFRNINAGSSKITVTLDSVNDEIDIDVNEAALTPTGANTALSNLITTSVNQSLIPSTTNSITLGSTTKQWKDGYFAGHVFAGNGSATATAYSFSSDTTMGVYRSADPLFPSFNALRIDGGADEDIYIGDGTTFISLFTDAALDGTSGGVEIIGSTNWTDGVELRAGASMSPIGTTGDYVLQFLERTGGVSPTPFATTMQISADPTAHRLQLSNNGGAFADIIIRTDTFTSSTTGLAPSSGGGTTNFLRADGTWAAPPGSGGGGSGANTALSNLTTTTINQGLLPAIDDGYDIGSSSKRWQDISASRTISITNNIATDIFEEVYSNTPTVFPTLSLKRAGGTSSVPAEVSSGDTLTSIDIYGHDGAAFAKSGAIKVVASEDWTPGARGATIDIQSTLTGQTSAATRIFIDGTGKVGIHTSSPQNTLHVVGDGYFGGFVRPQDTSTSASTAGDGAIRWRATNLQFSDGNDWFNITKGNTKLLPIIGDAAVPDVLHLFCNSVTGSDISGNGLSLSTAFASIQRALDEIPDGAQGFVQIDLVGAGPYKTWRVRNYHSDFLQISIVGDTHNSPAETWTLGAGSLPTNPTGGTKHGVFEYGVGSYTTALSDGYGWIEFQSLTGSSYITYAYTIDGYGSHSPNIRVAYPLDLGTAFSGTHGLLRPFITEIVGPLDAAPEYGTISHDSFPDGNSTVVFAMGLVFRDFAGLSVQRTNFKGCLFADSIITFTNNDSCFIDSICTGSTVYNALDGKSTSFQGIWTDDTTIQISGPMVETFMGGVLRNRDGSGISAYIGGVTGGRAPTPCAIEIEFLDLESIVSGDLAGFLIRGASVRFGNHAPISINNVSRWFRADLGARVTVVRANGGCRGVPCIFNEGVTAMGFDALDGDIFNLSSSGDEVTIGDIGTLAFSDLPQTDMANLIRVE